MNCSPRWPIALRTYPTPPSAAATMATMAARIEAPNSARPPTTWPSSIKIRPTKNAAGTAATSSTASTPSTITARADQPSRDSPYRNVIVAHSSSDKTQLRYVVLRASATSIVRGGRSARQAREVAAAFVVEIGDEADVAVGTAGDPAAVRQPVPDGRTGQRICH